MNKPNFNPNQPIQINAEEVFNQVSKIFGRELTPLEKMHVELSFVTVMAVNQITLEKQMGNQILASLPKGTKALKKL